MTQVAPRPARPGSTGPGHRRQAAAARASAVAGLRRGRHATALDQGFGGVVGWTILGSVVPGTGLLAAGRRSAGRALLGVTLAVLVGLAVVALVSPRTVVRLATRPTLLLLVAVVAVVAALLWGLAVLATHVSLRRFATLTRVQRGLSAALVTAILAAGAMVAAQVANYALIGRDTLTAITAGGVHTEHEVRPSADAPDPWAGTPRVNVLLVGSDAGADRVSVRTDSVILASIDTRTGDAVLFGIPRNLEHVPFPPGTPMAAQYPDGFTCDRPQDPCLFNALWQFGVQNASNSYYKKFPNPGLQATIDGAEQVTGLQVNQYLLLDLNGFRAFVNAIGGIDVTVRRPIPVGGQEDAYGRQIKVKSYIQPGRQHLDGYHALWYARSRSDSSDFDRMERQRCVIGAISQQADPVTLARSFPDLARAVQKDMSTSVKLDDLDAWVTLLLRVKSGHIRSLPFTDKNIRPGDPDFAYIRAKVRQALTPPAPATPSATAKAPAAGPTAGSSGTKRTTPAPKASAPASDPSKAVDVKEAC